MSTTRNPYFINPDDALRFTQMPGLESAILTGLNGESMMMVLSTTLPGHSVPIHTHPHEQIGMICSGKAELIIGNEKRIVQAGDLYCIPSNIPHGDTCIGDAPFVMLDIFYPVREDFLARITKKK
jgi:quercetin dioxygenase-like cupin family protein